MAHGCLLLYLSPCYNINTQIFAKWMKYFLPGTLKFILIFTNLKTKTQWLQDIMTCKIHHWLKIFNGHIKCTQGLKNISWFLKTLKYKGTIKSFGIENVYYINIISLFIISICSKYFPQFVHFLISWFAFDTRNIKLLYSRSITLWHFFPYFWIRPTHP